MRQFKIIFISFIILFVTQFGQAQTSAIFLQEITTKQLTEIHIHSGYPSNVVHY